MKRCWIGFFLLLVLLGVGIGTTWGMAKVHDPICQELEQAARSSLAENWGKAAYHTAQAQNQWDRWQLLRASLTDHDPTEEIDALFRALKVYGQCREEVAFSAICRELAKRIEAIGSAHGLVWENIL